MMRIAQALASGWLLLFWADSGLAVVDELLALATGLHLLYAIRAITGVVVMLGLPFLWLGVGLSPRLPMRVFLLPLVFLAWVLLGASPLSVWGLGTWWFGLSIAAVQGVVAAFVAWQVARLDRRGGKLLLEARAERPAVRWPRFAAWAVSHALLGPVLLLGYGWFSIDLALRHHTGGYMALGSDGVQAAHREWARDDRTVDLIGMVHLGDAQRYVELFAPIPVEGTLVLEEGVGDREGLLSEGPVYDKVAERLGLSVQGPVGEMSALETRNADLDVSAFSKDTLAFLRKVFALYRSDDPASAALDYYLFMRKQGDMEAFGRQVYDDIIGRRNAHLLEVLWSELETRPRLVVPWGAYHMPEIEAALVEAGFQRVGERRVTLIGFPWAGG